MKGSSSLFFVLLTTMLAKHLVAQPSEPTYLIEVCEEAYGTYTLPSIYGSNLVTLLSDLGNQSSTDPYYSTSVGISFFGVYGQYYCRGDIDADLCSSCVKEAAQVIQANCTNYNAASVWFDVCTLHYGNETTTGLWDSLPGIRGWVTNNVSDPSTFSVVLKDTVDTLISSAAEKFSHFATGEGKVSSQQTVYCLVQCSPDLNVSYCSACLQSTYVSMPQCCGEWPLQAYVFYRKCQLRYSTVAAFYKGSGSPSPALNSTPPSPGSSSPSPSLHSLFEQTRLEPAGGGSGSDRLKLGLVTIAIAFFIFVLNA